MEYGQIEDEVQLDGDGSTVTIERNYVQRKLAKPVRRRYKYRVRVTNKKEEMAEYLKFTDSLTDDKLDPAFTIERSKHGDANNYYFVVKCYTILDYTGS